MKEPYMKGLAAPSWPRVMCGQPVRLPENREPTAEKLITGISHHVRKHCRKNPLRQPLAACSDLYGIEPCTVNAWHQVFSGSFPSIVAISSIHLLKGFMNADQIANDKLMWYVIIHLTFVLSALGMAYVDKMNKT